MCAELDHPTPIPTRTPFVRRRGFLRGVGIAGLGVAGAGLLGTQFAAAATSQNGWPAAEDLPLNRDFNVGGVKFPQGVALNAPNTILGFVATRFAATVEPLITPGCWGFNYRPIGGGTTLSNHASGTALDFNAPNHPQGSRGTFNAGQVSAIRAILAYCEGVVRWGGDYTGTADEMHFELNRPPGHSSIATLVAKIGGTPPPPPTIQEGSQGEAVKQAQTALNAKGNYGLVVDGVFGAKTKAAVIDFQSKNGLTADGIVGPATWAKLLA
jgi:hypothetical protein